VHTGEQLSSDNDAHLVALARQGDEQACTLLVRKYERTVWACTMALTGNPADAADAAQETFIRFFRRIALYDSRRPLRPYLLKIAANCSRTLVARRRLQPESVDVLPLEAPAPDIERPDRKASAEERRHSIIQQIAELPPVMQQVCRLFYVGGCSCREIADVLGMTETAVKTALHRARKRLAPALAEWRSAAS